MEPMKKVKDLVMDLAAYPHMPYWATLREAMVQLNVTSQHGHDSVLVFDEAYRLVGILRQEDILKGLAKEAKTSKKKGPGRAWEDLEEGGLEARLDRPIQEFMWRVRQKIASEDSILDASLMLLQNDIHLLPVADDEKIIGVVRMADIFHEITNRILLL